jgi:ABC-type nitrate/sulfonate/bicarbonate transport system substrate-binding protein
MSEITTDVAQFDGDLFNANANRIPAEEVLRFEGRRIAYSRDGTCIVASGRDDEELEAALTAAGIDLSEVVLSYVPGDDEDPILL